MKLLSNTQHSRALKAKFVRTQQNISPPNRAKTPQNTVVTEVVGETEAGEGRIPPQETGYDWTPTNKKREDDWTPRKQQEIEDNDRNQITSINNEGKEQDPPNHKKASTEEKTSQELHAEVCASENTDEVTSFDKRNCKVVVTTVLNWSCMPPKNSIFDNGADHTCYANTWGNQIESVQSTSTKNHDSEVWRACNLKQLAL